MTTHVIGTRTSLVVVERPDRLPALAWLGAAPAGGIRSDAAGDLAALTGTPPELPTPFETLGRAVPLLGEVSRGWIGRRALRGHRIVDAASAGRDWSTRFVPVAIDRRDDALLVEAVDAAAGLALTTRIEAVAGGGVRMRHAVRNTGSGAYVVESLEVALPVPVTMSEQLDFTGRWALERMPQRRLIADGTWVRESTEGRPGWDSATMLVAGEQGFGFGRGQVIGVHVASAGETRHVLERQRTGIVTMGGGEALGPGEVVLAVGETYETPWVYAFAADDGLDGIAAQTHALVRSWHPDALSERPVTSNVWEAVYHDHDVDRLAELARLAAEVGVERFVLDDGWFSSRRDDSRGLGDWVVSEHFGPEGLRPLSDLVHDLGMRFGLWLEPEMVNIDSDLYRAHPEWILSTGGRVPVPMRAQEVLDLARPEVADHLFAQISRVLADSGVDYVKWDHNRQLFDAGSGTRGGASGIHAHTRGYIALLERLRAAHPDIVWEGCASGGARVDLDTLTRVERLWTSDGTDALSRQRIQRWTAQLAPLAWIGAHISAPRNHQTGRVSDLDFRVLTAFLGDLGIEWDLSSATAEERSRLRDWIGLYRRHRRLVHTGRLVRGDDLPDAVAVTGVVAEDRAEALFVYAHLEETVADPPPFRLPGLEPSARYRVSIVSPDDAEPAATEASGFALAAVGLLPPARWPQTARLVHAVRVD
ncbi:alpha-galactosidase [Microbacterium sp. 179-I 3D3 NHS]|uniref:alpha-galactosidase n=1 Tax=Microbacterium sp. 179-I 3D3 NHS TaxID=3142382 RepID=UPI0039A3E56B